MTTLLIVALALHILGAVVWVGGMAFALLALRPAAAGLDGPVRQALWRRTLGRFFALVWASIAALLLGGYAMIPALGGFADVGLHVHLMQATGILMMLLFLHVWFAPWKRFRRALDAGDGAAAGRQLDQIRKFVTINLALGLVTVLIGATGRYWG